MRTRPGVNLEKSKICMETEKRSLQKRGERPFSFLVQTIERGRKITIKVLEFLPSVYLDYTFIARNTLLKLFKS